MSERVPEPLTDQEIGSVRRLHPDGECDHTYSGCREAQWVATLDAARESRAGSGLDALRKLANRWNEQAAADYEYNHKSAEWCDAIRQCSRELVAELARLPNQPAAHHWDCRVPDGRECKSYRDGGSCVCQCHQPAAAPPPDEREGLREVIQAAREVMKEWDALGPTGTESTLSSHRRLRAALARLVRDAEPPAREEALREALTTIRDLTLDVPAAHGNPESYYLGQLQTAIGTAARALAAREAQPARKPLDVDRG